MLCGWAGPGPPSHLEHVDAARDAAGTEAPGFLLISVTARAAPRGEGGGQSWRGGSDVEMTQNFREACSPPTSGLQLLRAEQTQVVCLRGGVLQHGGHPQHLPHHVKLPGHPQWPPGLASPGAPSPAVDSGTILRALEALLVAPFPRVASWFSWPRLWPRSAGVLGCTLPPGTEGQRGCRGMRGTFPSCWGGRRRVVPRLLWPGERGGPPGLWAAQPNGSRPGPSECPLRHARGSPRLSLLSP